MFTLIRFAALAMLSAATAWAQTPEATDPDVARCAAEATKRLSTAGDQGRQVASVAADRVNASIDRWEEAFSKTNPQRVATLISVPLQINFDDGRNPPRALATARCGFSNSKLLAFEIVPLAMPVPR